MEENNRFLSFDGIIGRRNFIINYFIVVVLINLIFSTPAIFYMLFHPELLYGINSIFLLIWIMLSRVIYAGLLYPSIVRRIRDIAPGQSENNIYIYSSLILFVLILNTVPVFWQMMFFQILNIVLILTLMCLQGTTTRMPKSDIVKFNWGAFFGTWIWGLFNKTPITLLMIPLLFTTASLPFALICGLKGNEWAYNNKYGDDIEAFHKSQKKQAIIWTIITPFMCLVLFVASFFIFGLTIETYSKAHPDFKGNIENVAKNYQQAATNSYFSEIKKVGNEYQFYMDPKIWTKLSNSGKISVFNIAAEYVELQMPKTDKNKTQPDKMKIIQNIKIYSTFNNELLGEYKLNEKVIQAIEKDKTSSLREVAGILKTVKEGYKFNNRPSLP